MQHAQRVGDPPGIAEREVLPHQMQHLLSRRTFVPLLSVMGQRGKRTVGHMHHRGGRNRHGRTAGDGLIDKRSSASVFWKDVRFRVVCLRNALQRHCMPAQHTS
jgi:hypothetical protein